MKLIWQELERTSQILPRSWSILGKRFDVVARSGDFFWLLQSYYLPPSRRVFRSIAKQITCLSANFMAMCSPHLSMNSKKRRTKRDEKGLLITRLKLLKKPRLSSRMKMTSQKTFKLFVYLLFYFLFDWHTRISGYKSLHQRVLKEEGICTWGRKTQTQEDKKGLQHKRRC